MIGHVMDLTELGQFDIITYLEFNLLLIIRHLTYLTFLVNLLNQTFESTYKINFFIKLTVLLASGTLHFLTNVHM